MVKFLKRYCMFEFSQNVAKYGLSPLSTPEHSLYPHPTLFSSVAFTALYTELWFYLLSVFFPHNIRPMKVGICFSALPQRSSTVHNTYKYPQKCAE